MLLVPVICSFLLALVMLPAHAVTVGMKLFALALKGTKVLQVLNCLRSL